MKPFNSCLWNQQKFAYSRKTSQNTYWCCLPCLQLFCIQKYYTIPWIIAHLVEKYVGECLHNTSGGKRLKWSYVCRDEIHCKLKESRFSGGGFFSKAELFFQTKTLFINFNHLVPTHVLKRVWQSIPATTELTCGVYFRQRASHVIWSGKLFVFG